MPLYIALSWDLLRPSEFSLHCKDMTSSNMHCAAVCKHSMCDLIPTKRCGGTVLPSTTAWKLKNAHLIKGDSWIYPAQQSAQVHSDGPLESTISPGPELEMRATTHWLHFFDSRRLSWRSWNSVASAPTMTTSNCDLFPAIFQYNDCSYPVQTATHPAHEGQTTSKNTYPVSLCTLLHPFKSHNSVSKRPLCQTHNQ